MMKKKNLRDGQPSGPRLQWTLPQKTASVGFWLTGETPGKPLENTHTSSSWRVPSRLFRSRSAGFLFELRSGSSLQRCFALCERTTVENWRTTAAVLMWCYLQLIGLIWTGSCVTILPSHSVRQVRGSECHDFRFGTCIVTALVRLFKSLEFYFIVAFQIATFN